jgi:hypothetical protein
LKLTLAAVSAALLGVSAQANDFTGRELQSRTEAQGQSRSRINWRGEIGYRFIDRTFETNVGDFDFNSHELSGNLTGHYRNWFLSGGYSHSVASSDLDGNFDTDSWGASGTAGYQFHLNRNLTVAPFVGFSWVNSELGAGAFGAGETDIGLGGFNFGAALKWTPGFSAAKPFPKWSVFGSFAYFPSLSVSDDVDDAGGDGEDGFLASVGVEHNFNSRTFATLYYQFAQFNVDGPFAVAFDQKDHRAGATVGLRF